ncbi:HmuY protein [Pedobacter steynii]|uniref:HmuY protein n=1 Tax=Pedobacter steynii TaxID=430522 RepID=A0A1H0AL81_9SPHI|nr:HmuY family protein [Pedobacter steynii]NQX41342.1 hypothetical protein [Pedobacter steynii]SDN33586.1 HmuY protein [Pedobacter steynii]
MKTTKFTLCTVLCTLILISCKKDQPVAEVIPEQHFIQVSNLKIADQIVGKSADAQDDAEGLWYYSLDEQKVLPASAHRTDQWDFAFDFDLNRIIVNNGNYTSGSVIPGNEGKALITIVAKPFEQVMEAPSNDEMYNKRVDYEGKYGNTSFTLNGDTNPGILGWMSAFENGVLLKVVKPLKNRTIIFKTNKGKYAKLQIQSVYKDSPENPTESSEKFYLSFRFFLQKDGSRNLDSSK